MHVLVAAHDLYPDPGSGGTGRYVYETATRLVARDHRVSVVTRRRGDVPGVETVEGIDVYRYDLQIAGETGPAVAAQLPRAARTVRRSLERIRASNGPPDVVNFQGSATALLVDRLVDDSVGRTTTYHSPWSTEYRIRTRPTDLSALRRRFNAALRLRLERRLVTRSDAVVTLSEYMREQLGRAHGDVDAAVIPGGVDHERYTPDAGPFDRMDVDGPAFLTVRRLSPRMGHDLLLDAFAAVLEAHPDARLFVAGDGPRRDALERQAAALGIGDATTFLGYVPDADLPAAFATADVFVLPTRKLEGFGLATLEALAAGTPVVATPVGGTVEVLDGLDATAHPGPATVDDVDPASLADGMRQWADASPEARRDAGRDCRAYVRDRFTWDRTVDALEAHYRAVASTGDDRSRKTGVPGFPLST